ncbi:MAG: leucine-rich repeat domain-containing protein, partial [Ruminococcus sp.]|nr:leucine-rich repeat domain-containing protein [Candidatus Apopatosoma intestinale]
MKKIISAILIFTTVVALVLAGTLTVSADNVASGSCGAQGDNLTWTLDSTGTLPVSGTGAMVEYEEYSACPWYSYRKSIRNVVIGEGVTSIGNYAFWNCYNLTSITIPEGVTSIGIAAFAYCSGLTSITIPVSVTSIGYGAFSGCSGLTEITVASNNGHYTSIDGVLFTADGKTLICYPAGRTATSYTV